MKKQKAVIRFVLYIRNDGCDDLELRKVYQVITDPNAAEEGYIRIIDESGEDYLYPVDYFVPVELPDGRGQGLGGARLARRFRGRLEVVLFARRWSCWSGLPLPRLS